MIYIGIDPGLTGAVAILTDAGDVSLHDTPVIREKGKNYYDVQGMHSVLWNYPSDTVVALELVHAMPGQGVVSMFRFGEGYGIWQGIIAVNGYRLVQPSPQKWMKTLGVTPHRPSRVVAVERFPTMGGKLHRVSDHNRADALCLAWYAKVS